MAKAKKSWLKTGADAAAGMNQEHEEREKEFNSLWRFYIKPEAETKITFLEGTLIEKGPQKGMFDTVYVREHRISVPGKKVPDYYACVAEEEECPLCAMDNRSSYVGLFTIIDHSKFTAQTGKVYTNQRKIFAAKSGTLKRLIRKAKANEGSLVGSTFSVARSEVRSATVGDEFELLATNSLAAIGAKLDPKNPEAAVAPANWEEELTYLDAAALRQKFHVSGPEGPGYGSDAPPGTGYQGDAPAGDDELPPIDEGGDDLPF